MGRPGAVLRARSGLATSIGVANVTRGDEQYSPTVDALVDEYIKIQVAYTNESSAREVSGLAARIVLPTNASNPLVISAEVSAEGNTLRPSTLVRLSVPSARLSYVAKSLVWRHLMPTKDGSQAYVDEQLPEATLVGIPSTLQNLAPGEKATLTMLVQVVGEVFSVVVRCAHKGNDTFSQQISAKAGDTLDCAIDVKNEGNVSLRRVEVYDNLGRSMTLLEESVRVERGHEPSTALSGFLVDPLYPTGDNRPSSRRVGLQVGDLPVGSGLTVHFSVRIDKSAPGGGALRNIAIARALGTNEIFNVVVIRIAVT